MGCRLLLSIKLREINLKSHDGGFFGEQSNIAEEETMRRHNVQRGLFDESPAISSYCVVKGEAMFVCVCLKR